jgi:hypothetical protein
MKKTFDNGYEQKKTLLKGYLAIVLDSKPLLNSPLITVVCSKLGLLMIFF